MKTMMKMGMKEKWLFICIPTTFLLHSAIILILSRASCHKWSLAIAIASVEIIQSIPSITTCHAQK